MLFLSVQIRYDVDVLKLFHNKRSIRVKNNHDDEALAVIEGITEEGNAGCQVRRKIEDYLERRRNKDELGELSEITE